MEELSVYTFGQNSYGELIHGDNAKRLIPSISETCQSLGVIDVAAGNEHTSLLCSDGNVYTCGYNESGQCGVGNTQRTNSLQLVKTLSDKKIVYLSCANGCEHVAALSENGEIYTWGNNVCGQLGHGHVNSPVVIPQVIQALHSKRVVKVACNYFHTVLATDDNEVYSFGRNDYGQLGLGSATDDFNCPQLIKCLSGKSPVVALACGQFHTIISFVDGKVYTFGHNSYGQLGVDFSEPKLSPVLIPMSTWNEDPVVQLGCGYFHTAALTSSGIIYTFGSNTFGQLGLSHKQNQSLPTVVEALLNASITQITCGCYHTLALCDRGKVYPFGRNNQGQLGLQNTHNTSTPQIINSLQGKYVQKITAGFYHTLCLVGNIPLYTPSPKANTLTMDLLAMVNNKKTSDVTFVVENQVIYAHRCIIMARCEPLDRMLNGPMLEAQQKEIILPDQTYTVFLAFLEFLYTDTVVALHSSIFDLDYVLDLLTLADQFLVEKLKWKCSVVLQENMKFSNVSTIFHMADLRHIVPLRSFCFKYMMENICNIIGSKAFLDLPQELLQEVLNGASRRGIDTCSISSSPLNNDHESRKKTAIH